MVKAGFRPGLLSHFVDVDAIAIHFLLRCIDHMGQNANRYYVEVRDSRPYQWRASLQPALAALFREALPCSGCSCLK